MVKRLVCLCCFLLGFLALLHFGWAGDEKKRTPTSNEDGKIRLFPQLVKAKNPTSLLLQEDGRKIVGQVIDDQSFCGLPVTFEYQTKDGKKETVHQVLGRAQSRFEWVYPFTETTKVTCIVQIDDKKTLRETLTVRPSSISREKTVFFIVDRTAYRPSQVLHFAGFLRKLDSKGEWEPIANEAVTVELTSASKGTKAAKLKLTSDANGKIIGSYLFSEGDALDTYNLAIPTYRGSAQLLVGEYRKSKIKLKISGEIVKNHLDLKFETLDFVDKPVAASKVFFTAQVVQKAKKETKPASMKSEEFVFHGGIAGGLSLEEMEEEERLMWLANGTLPIGVGYDHVVSQVQQNLSLQGKEPGKYTLELKPEWKNGTYTVLIQGVVTDANGREQRASITIPIACSDQTTKYNLILPKETYSTSEKIPVQLTTQNGKAIEGKASLVAMKLTPNFAAQMYGNVYGYGAYPLYSYRGGRYRGPIHTSQQDTFQRNLVTAIPFSGDSAVLKLTEPGAYKLVAVIQKEDGTTQKTEVGCVVKNSEDISPLVLHLSKVEFESGESLQGRIFSQFTNAKIWMILRDSQGIQLDRVVEVDENGEAKIDFPLPKKLGYGCHVDLMYVDDVDSLAMTSRYFRVVPKDRMLTIKTTLPEEVKPGQEVPITLQVDRQEEVDLVVSVYDQALLGINADKSVDIRNFYLADERVRSTMGDYPVRLRLGKITVEALVKKAEELLKDQVSADTQEGVELQQLINQVRHSHCFYTNNLVTMVRLAGIDVQLQPMFYSYGTNWYTRCDKTDVPLADFLDVKTNDFSLLWSIAGDHFMVNEWHPSWANNLHVINRFRNLRYSQFNEIFAYQSAGFGGRGMARGDAFGMLSANSSPSFLEGQAVMSHIPVGGAAPIGLIDTDADQSHIAVRRDFSDSAYWNANVRTDKTGKATVNVKVPDSLTNWQVVVTAISKNMHVGTSKEKFRTFKPIMIWPMLPRAFTEGDSVEIFGTAHNRTEKDQLMRVRLKVENGEIVSKDEQVVHVPAKSSANVYWVYRPKQMGYTQILMTADCEAGSDASLKRLPVQRCAVEETITLSGRVRDSAEFTIPETVDLKQAQLEMTFAPNLAADMADTLNFLVDYPYGCVEQTMSRFLPAIKVAQVLYNYEIEHKELKEKLPKCVEMGIKRLLELQQGDGGWGWHGGSQTHEMMTPYALYGLLQAEKANYLIPNETAIQRGLQRLRYFIESMQQEQQIADRIYCMYVYGHREQLEPAWWDAITTAIKQDKLSDYAAALALELAVQQKKTDLAKQLVQLLHKRATKENGHVFWTTAYFSRWGNDRFEITAAVMKALVANDKDDPLVDGILAFFNATKRGDRWNSTKDTAMIVFAICDYLAKEQQAVAKEGNQLTVSINKANRTEVTFKDRLTQKIKIDGKQLNKGKNQIDFQSDIPGVMYRMVLRYWKTGQDIEASQKGIEVTRTFELLDDKGNVVRLLKNGDTVPRGSYIRSCVTATDKLHQDMRYVLVENPKPSSAEILPVDDARFNRYSSSHFALREERNMSVAFHHEQTPQTLFDNCILLAELSGRFVIPPAYVELMYQTERRGHSASFVLNVQEEPKK